MNDLDETEDGAELSPRERLLLELDEQQSFQGALWGGIGMSALAIAFCYPLAKTFGQPIGLYSVFMGILVAFGVRNWGRGLDRRFSLLGSGLTFFSLVIGTLLTESVLVVETSRYKLGYFLWEFMNFHYAWNLISTRMGFKQTLLWVLALVLGYRQSIRKLQRSKLARLRSGS